MNVQISKLLGGRTENQVKNRYEHLARTSTSSGNLSFSNSREVTDDDNNHRIDGVSVEASTSLSGDSWNLSNDANYDNGEFQSTTSIPNFQINNHTNDTLVAKTSGISHNKGSHFNQPANSKLDFQYDGTDSKFSTTAHDDRSYLSSSYQMDNLHNVSRITNENMPSYDERQSGFTICGQNQSVKLKQEPDHPYLYFDDNHPLFPSNLPHNSFQS